MARNRAFLIALASVLSLALAANGQPVSPLPPTPEAVPTAEASAEAQPGKIGPDGKAEAPAAPKAVPVAGWDDMFYLRSPDKRFSLRFTGQVQGDYRNYLNPNDTTDLDNFVIRRARIGLEALLFQNYEFRFLTDFGQGQTRLVDGYMNVRYWDEAQLTFGKFKQPFSYEQLIQDRFTPFVERSLIDQVVPARDIGVMVHGQNLFNGMLDYGVATSNGVQNGDSDTNGAKDATGRIAVRPFAWWDDSPLRYFQLGMAVNGGNQNEPMNPLTLRTPGGVPYFKFNSTVVADGRRIRYSPEVVYFYGGLGVSAQYFRMDQRVRAAGTGALSRQSIDVPFEGYYVQASYLLTGEQRTMYGAVDPLRPFDPRKGLAGLGAWETVARVSRLHVGDVVFASGNARLADPTTVSNDAVEMTLGYNWYLNKWVRMQFNWEHAWFNQPVRLGPTPRGVYTHHDTLQARLQFVF